MKMAIFIDTGYILALINTADEYHKQAITIASEMKGPFVTT
jgi:predicted nucleic acid-binding protein